MILSTRVWLVFFGSFAVACSSSATDAGAQNEDSFIGDSAGARVTFTTGVQALDGRIFEGESVKIAYELQRITSCTRGDGDPHHGPQFDYTLFYKWQSAPDASFHSTLIANANGPAQVALTAPFQATGLELYVQLTNPRGCSEFDSASGKNFTFPVSKARLPAVHFNQDGSVAQDGSLSAGSTILVDYASPRLANCNQSGRKLTMFGRIDGRDLPPQDLAEESRYLRTIGSVKTTEGATRLELWFETVDSHACTQWDSAEGRNFGFDLR